MSPITGSPFSFFASGVVLTSYVSKSGTLFMFGTASAAGESNGAWPLANITAVNATPVIKVNGNVVSIGPGTWSEVDHDTCFVAYLARCGGVAVDPDEIRRPKLHGTNCDVERRRRRYRAHSRYADSGGWHYVVRYYRSGLGHERRSLALDGAGRDVRREFRRLFQNSATAYVTVSGGRVVNVVPVNGTVQGMGAAYEPSVTSFTAGFNNATITCNVSNYIQSVPVTNHGSGFTSPPTYTITDSTGSGAVAAPIMNGPASTDTCTYTVADGWLTTTLGPVLGATNGAPTKLRRSTRRAERESERLSCDAHGQDGRPVRRSAYQQPDRLPVFRQEQTQVRGVWKTGSGTSSFALDSNYFPVSWTPGGTLMCQFYADASGSGRGAAGIWTLVYDDEFYATPSRAPAATSVFLTGAGSQVSRTVSGTTVTITYSYPVPNQVDFSDLEFNVVAPSDGLWHLKDQSGVSDPVGVRAGQHD